MKKNKKFLTIIPARSGSKGIKNKNVRSFCGKPLISYTISEAKKSKYLDRIIVSTESEEYAKIAKKYGAEVPFLRPKKLAEDKSLIIDTVIDILKKLEKQENYKPDYVVLLQTTSPLRTVEDIDKCIEIALKKKCDGVMTMSRTECLFYTIDKNGFLKLIFNKDWERKTNRQAIPSIYLINGPAVIITGRDYILKHKSLWTGKMQGVIMPRWRSVDLDNEEQFLLAELIHKNKKLFL